MGRTYACQFDSKGEMHNGIPCFVDTLPLFPFPFRSFESTSGYHQSKSMPPDGTVGIENA